MSASEEIKTPWKDGMWYSETSKQSYIIVNGNEAKWMKLSCLDYPDANPMMVGTWNYGEFEDAKPEVAAASGKDKCNLEMDLQFMKLYGVVTANGTKICTMGDGNKMEIYKCLSDEEFDELKADRDPIDAPPNPHVTPKPGQVGKVIWISGKVKHENKLIHS